MHKGELYFIPDRKIGSIIHETNRAIVLCSRIEIELEGRVSKSQLNNANIIILLAVRSSSQFALISKIGILTFSIKAE